LLLRCKFRPHAARLARVTVGDLKKYRLLPFAEFPLGWQSVGMKQPALLFLIRILRHRPEIVLGVLEIILRCDPVSRQGFGAGQDQIAFIVSFCAMSVSRLGAGEPGRFIFAGGVGSSRRCARHNFRIWAWLCRYGFKFRNVFHVHPYAAPAEAVRRSFEELSCCNTVDGRAAVRAAIKLQECGKLGLALDWEHRGLAERIHIDRV
jgi:hypothetical protein